MDLLRQQLLTDPILRDRYAEAERARLKSTDRAAGAMGQLRERIAALLKPRPAAAQVPSVS
jgi:hypothetical protein